jgi:hypothetical protein
MCEQAEVISERYEGLETRRKREAEGYQADISALKQKLKHLEQQLVRATINKAKGNFYFNVLSVESQKGLLRWIVRF